MKQQMKNVLVFFLNLFLVWLLLKLLFTYYMELIMRNIILEAKKFINNEDGVTAIEYGLIVALISSVIVGVVNTVGQNLVTVFSKIATALV